MSYSISVIHDNKPDRNGFVKLRIQVIYQRMKAYAPTVAKVTPDQYAGGRVVKHPKATKINAAITAQVSAIEDRLLDDLRKAGAISRSRLVDLVRNSGSAVQSSSRSIVDYADQLQDDLEGKMSSARLKSYATVAAKIEEFSPAATFAQVSPGWLLQLEKFIRGKGEGVQANTVHNNMSVVRAILNKAAIDGLVQRDQFENYRLPAYKEEIPVFLEEAEISALADLLRAMGDCTLKIAGHYFLLSCYAGYRIGDCLAFSYADQVHSDQITIRAGKNGRIVSIPVHSRLASVLEYIRDRPLAISEQHLRKFVKQAVKLAGIKKPVKFHTGRHSFAMLLMKSGFSVDEVAHLLGDSPAVARVYAKIHNPTLNAKVRNLLG